MGQEAKYLMSFVMTMEMFMLVESNTRPMEVTAEKYGKMETSYTLIGQRVIIAKRVP